MSGKDAKVGLSADLFDTNGHPTFGEGVLSREDSCPPQPSQTTKR
jgi:hypothetical protein